MVCWAGCRCCGWLRVLHAAAQQRVWLVDCVGTAAANAGAMIASVVGGMVVGADPIGDLGSDRARDIAGSCSVGTEARRS